MARGWSSGVGGIYCDQDIQFYPLKKEIFGFFGRTFLYFPKKIIENAFNLYGKDTRPPYAHTLNLYSIPLLIIELLNEL